MFQCIFLLCEIFPGTVYPCRQKPTAAKHFETWIKQVLFEVVWLISPSFVSLPTLWLIVYAWSNLLRDIIECRWHFHNRHIAVISNLESLFAYHIFLFICEVQALVEQYINNSMTSHYNPWPLKVEKFFLMQFVTWLFILFFEAYTTCYNTRKQWNWGKEQSITQTIDGD